jgi:hypothetical protein
MRSQYLDFNRSMRPFLRGIPFPQKKCKHARPEEGEEEDSLPLLVSELWSRDALLRLFSSEMAMTSRDAGARAAARGRLQNSASILYEKLTGS